jgi:hypothetical protein
LPSTGSAVEQAQQREEREREALRELNQKKEQGK